MDAGFGTAEGNEAPAAGGQSHHLRSLNLMLLLVIRSGPSKRGVAPQSHHLQLCPELSAKGWPLAGSPVLEHVGRLEEVESRLAL